MALNEIKTRLNSVRSTLKITSAMKLIASAKLHKAQTAMGNLLPYENEMQVILSDLIAACQDKDAGTYSIERPVKKVAITAISSSSSLCGAFNSNVCKKLSETIDRYRKEGVSYDNIIIYSLGRKVAEYLRKIGLPITAERNRLSEKPDYEGAAAFAEELTRLFTSGEVDRIELVYGHYVTTSSQQPVTKTFLPIALGNVSEGGITESGYILEPGASSLIEELLPKVLKLKIYTALLDASAAEHAARTVAMQTATDNGENLLQELTLQYNKSRQQAITNELLDIVGGSMA